MTKFKCDVIKSGEYFEAKKIIHTDEITQVIFELKMDRYSFKSLSFTKLKEMIEEFMIKQGLCKEPNVELTLF